MRCDAINGYYVQYKDSGRPVESLDRIAYSFQSADRTCLIQRADHLAMLLKTDRYRVVGVELAEAPIASSEKPAQEKPKPGHPRRGA